ncbi:MAG: hypothetical protein U0869_05560 [Chloroflexota bacterium]
MGTGTTAERIARYRRELDASDDWDAFLCAESGLPGPRGNLELMALVAERGDEVRFRRYAALDSAAAPTNTPGEFLAGCGVLGLGRLAAGGRDDLLPELRAHARDPRWRVRESVAMALQLVGDASTDRLLAVLRSWAGGDALEQRAVVAAICEPRLLRDPDVAAAAIDLLDGITAGIAGRPDRRSEAVVALRKALGYGWSVVAAALPARGLPALERWAGSPDPDLRWIVRENLGKDRLRRTDAAWVARQRERIGA